jgi:hypothetical protein
VATVLVVVVGSLAAVLVYANLRDSGVSTLPTTSSFTGSSASSGGPSTTYSTTSAAGLQLQVTLNSSSIQPHGEVSVQIELLNLQNQNVTEEVVPNQNISAWNGYDFYCAANPSHSLVGFALLSGRFAAANVSAAGSPLQLAGSSVAIPCPYSLPLNGTTFLPDSDRTASFSYYGQTQEPPYSVLAEVNATTGYCTYSSTFSGDCQETSGILGYWDAGFGDVGNSSLGSKDFKYLPSGEYTVAATDDWGQTVYAHFQVTSGTSTAGTVYTVTFQQAGTCNPTIYAPKWSVTLGNETRSAQTNNSASNTEYAEPLPPPPIVFSVADGVYQYSVGPSNDGFQPASGTVTVNGADVVVTVTGPATSCTMVATG